MKKITYLFVASILAVLSNTVCMQAQTQLNLKVLGTVDIICGGDTTGKAGVSANGGEAPYTYLWMPGADTSRIDSDMAAGTYTLTVKDFLDDSVVATITITQPTPISISLTSHTNVSCPGGSNGRASVAVSGGFSPYTYSWSDGDTTAIDSDMSAGIYTVTVTDSSNCTHSATVNIGVNSTLSAIITNITNASCFGMGNGSALATGLGGLAPYRYLWQPVGYTTAAATALPASTYTSEVTDAGGCMARSAVAIAQPAPLILTGALVDSIAYALVSGGTAPYTYRWYPGGNTSSITSGISAGIYTVTVTDANGCEDSALVDIPFSLVLPNLILSLSSPFTECFSTGPLFGVNIMATSDSNERFNSCVAYINYHGEIPGSEFYGDDSSNIFALEGYNFTYAPGENDYGFLTWSTIGDSILVIHFGNPSDSSPQGTFVNSVPQLLFQARFPIQNCGGGTTIDTMSIGESGTFALSDSVPTLALDSTYVDSLCCAHLCNPYLCNEYCCIVDSIGDCLDSCWDTCYSICYDTIWHYSYFYHTIYVYYSQNLPYGSVRDTGSNITAFSCPPAIAYSTPIINAGTNAKSVPPNSSILTITGSGFGSQRDSIQVSNANTSGMVTLDTSDILYWLDGQIKVRMPGVLMKYRSGMPGTGPITVYSTCGGSVQANLTINYSIEDGLFGANKSISNVVMSNDTASIIWRCDTSIWNNPNAIACVKNMELLYGGKLETIEYPYHERYNPE